MNPRKTTTGAVLEQMILPALEHGGYRVRQKVNIGQRLGGGRHIVDALAEDPEGRRFLVSLKWQQVPGTAEQKVPFEVMCLAEAVLASGGLYQKAYLVLGGAGWKLREFYTGGGLQRYLCHSDLVSILSLEDFVGRANQGKL
jgi:hypothetical protein